MGMVADTAQGFHGATGEVYLPRAFPSSAAIHILVFLPDHPRSKGQAKPPTHQNTMKTINENAVMVPSVPANQYRLRPIWFKQTVHWLVLIFCTMVMTSRLSAQTFPYWDGMPDTDLAGGGPSGFSEAYSAGLGVGDGQNVYFIGDGGGGNIYQWSETNGWTLIGTASYMGYFNCMAIQGHFLYVGGSFTDVSVYGGSATNATDIAKYDLNTGQWYPIGDDNISRIPLSIAVDNFSNIYVGTKFQYHVDTNAIMKWNGNWTGLEGSMISATNMSGEGFEPWVTSMATDGTNIFAAGGFDGAYQTNGDFIGSHGIIEWNGTNWIQVGANESGASYIPAGLTGIFMTNDPVGYEPTSDPWSIAITGTNLFVVGPFIYPNIRIARFSTVSGNSLSCPNLTSGTGDPYIVFGTPCMNLVNGNGNIYLVGDFDHVGSVSANGVVCWTNDGTTYGGWSALGDGLTLSGSSASAECIAANSNAVFVASFGYGFDTAGDVPITNSPSIARWMLSPDPETVSFTGGSIASTDGIPADLIGNVDAFTFNLAGTPRSTWTIKVLDAGVWYSLTNIQLGADGTGVYTDMYAGTGNWQTTLYQLSNANTNSAVFGYEWEDLAAEGESYFTNPFTPLSPGTFDSMFPPSLIYDGSGNNWEPPGCTDYGIILDWSGNWSVDYNWDGADWSDGDTVTEAGDYFGFSGLGDTDYYVLLMGSVPP